MNFQTLDKPEFLEVFWPISTSMELNLWNYKKEITLLL